MAVFLLAVAAMICGIVASIYWYRSAGEPWLRNSQHHIFDHDFDMPETSHRMAITMLWVEVKSALDKAAKLNRTAALWTAASVVLSSLSGVCGAWPFSN